MPRRNSSAPVSMGLVIVATVFLFTRLDSFADLASTIADWGWHDNQVADVIPDSAPLTVDDLIGLLEQLGIHLDLPDNPTDAPVATDPAGTVDDVIDPTSRRLAPLEDDNERATARSLIDQLDTAPPGPADAYDRDQFGQSWSDAGTAGLLWSRNGCDTRNDLLRRDLDNPEIRPGTNGCVAVAGTLPDPYTGTVIDFHRNGNPSAVQIDHIIPLAEAWRTGAANWDDDTRLNFANDPLNLLAVDGPANQSKGDSPPSEWMPDPDNLQCSYAARYAAVAVAYDLPVTDNSKDTMLRACA